VRFAPVGARRPTTCVDDPAPDPNVKDIYVIGFYCPVVPKGQAGIRRRFAAGHAFSHVDRAVEAFTRVGGKYDILGKSKEQIIAKYGE